MIHEFAAALKATEKAAFAYRAAHRGKPLEWYYGPECAAMKAACEAQVGPIAILAAVGGNTVRQHCRHTFKIEGKRAARAEVEKFLKGA